MGYQQNYPQVYPQQTQQMQQPQNNSIVWVQGIEGAKAHPVAPGQAVILMDSDADCLYLKSADMTGMPSLRVFDYKERSNAPQETQNKDMSKFLTEEDVSDYVTKDELKKAISDLKKGMKKNE